MRFFTENDNECWAWPSRLFVGRGEELAALESSFRKGTRNAVIVGPAAIGKTEIACEFALRNRELFPGGVAFEYGYRSFSLDGPFGYGPLSRLPTKPCLLVVNDAEVLNESHIHVIESLLKIQRDLHLIVTTRQEMACSWYRDPRDCLTLRIGPLSQRESKQLLDARLHDVPDDVFGRLYDLSQGHPLVLDLASRAVESGRMSWDTFFQRLADFQRPGLLGPDGQPIQRGAAEETRIITDVTEVNDELLRMLRKQPDLLQTLPPRKFEEVVAEILSRLGYAVNLTPASGDGGFDVFAAKKDNLGSFLFLVECKRYVPPNKVGVDIIRSLHGVVQSKKATAGIVATTSFFTTGAREFQNENKHQMHLRDYLDMQSWLQEISC